MNKIVIHGRKMVGGKVTAEALVSQKAIGGFGSVDPGAGKYTERTHELCGCCFTGKILVFPNAKGSSGWSANWKFTRDRGTRPAGMLVRDVGSRSALGAVVMDIPAMTDFDIDPLTVIETGDLVEIDADAGIVTVTKKERKDR